MYYDYICVSNSMTKSSRNWYQPSVSYLASTETNMTWFAQTRNNPANGNFPV